MTPPAWTATENKKAALIKKELVFRTFDESITSVHIGFLPPSGRYFIRQMTRRDRHSFELQVLLLKGKTFYHYFFNGNFTVPQNTGTMVPHDTQKRAALVLETSVFCPVQFLNEPHFVSPVSDGVWEFRVLTQQSWIKQVQLIGSGQPHSFSPAFADKNTTYWTARIKPGDDFRFCIKVAGNGQERFLHAGLRLRDLPVPADFFTLLADQQEHQPPPRFRAGYQVLPDRYCRMPQGQEWGTEAGPDGNHGGNLKGIASRLESIAALGVDFIYLNPVFLSKAYHHYDCSDFRQVDPLLGTEADLLELVQKAHRLNIRLVLDICLNHCSTGFFAFRDVLENQQDSAYKNWFEINHFPVSTSGDPSYSCWHGHGHLPQFNFNEPQVVDYSMDIARYWTANFGIDGWRLDVCTELPPHFIKQFAAAVRAINPHIVLIGETWQSQLRQLAGEGIIDGITNYSFYLDAVLPFFGHETLPVSRLGAAIMKSVGQHAFRTNAASWNFLSNHDIPRFYSILKNKKLYLAAFALLYALPGVPVIYYGEELCMEGLADPDNRRCMPADPPGDTAVVEGLKYLNVIKARHAGLLSLGMLAVPYTSEAKNMMVIQRTLGDEHLYFVFNFDDCPHTCPHSFPEEGGGVQTPVYVPPHSVEIIYAKTPCLPEAINPLIPGKTDLQPY